MKTIKIGDITEQHIGQTFYGAYGASGFVDKITILEINGDNILHSSSNNALSNYVRWAHRDWELLLNEQDAQDQVDNYSHMIEKRMDTPEKLMNYMFNSIIFPVSELRYNDIVGELGFSEVEMRIYKQNVKKFFGIDLVEEETE